jgi:hypothetical protein
MVKGPVMSMARTSYGFAERARSELGRAQIPSTSQPPLENKVAAASPRKPQPAITTLGKRLRAS